MSMSVSVQKSSTKTNIKHNNRTMSEKEQERNPHIDKSRSSENKYLVQKDLKELYEQEFGGALEKYNAKQKRHDRKIKNYYEHIKGSKKTSVQQEMIVQIGDKDDFLNPENKKVANEILEKWFEDFEKRNPNLKVYNAVIHNDEASPHLHLNFVPVAGDYKNGLEKQVSFDRAIIQQDSTMKKERPFDQWREKEVSLLEEKLNEHGIERKLVGKNNYKDVNEYKEKKDLEREIQFLEKKIVGKKKELIDVSEALPMKNIDIKTRPEIKTEVKQKLFGDAEVIKKETGNAVLTPKQLKGITGYVNAALAVKKDYDRLLTTDLVQENTELNHQVNSLFNSLKESREENKTLRSEINSLEFENRDLKGRISDLKAEIGLVYKSAREFLKERTDNVRAFRRVFGELVSKVKEKTTGSEFERLHKRDLRKERDKGLER